MKNFKNNFLNNRVEIFEVFIAFLAMLTIWTGIISAKDLIVNILLFIVFIELARMVITFVNEGKLMKIKYMIDGTIAFLLREMIIAITDTHHTIDHKLLETGLIIFILVFLFIFRLISTKFSQGEEVDE